MRSFFRSLENLFQPGNVLFSLFQMGSKTRLELGGRRGLRHLGKSFYKPTFGTVEVRPSSEAFSGWASKWQRPFEVGAARYKD